MPVNLSKTLQELESAAHIAWVDVIGLEASLDLSKLEHGEQVCKGCVAYFDSELITARQQENHLRHRIRLIEQQIAGVPVSNL